MLQTIEADADRVTRLITELLDISRIDAGRLQVRKQPVDVHAAINRHIERFVASGYQRERFTLSGHEAELPEVWADPDRLDQILANLMENAVRHGEGTVSLTVAPTGQNGDEAVAVTISDEGEGIAPENYPMIFTRFWHRSPRGRHRPGPVRRARTGGGPRREGQRRQGRIWRGRVPVHLARRCPRERHLTSRTPHPHGTADL